MPPEPSFTSYFAGKRILVVEDEFLLAEQARKKLVKLGAFVVGPTARIQQAIAFIETERIDAAILDIFLDDTLVFPVAELLDARKIPFVFASAYDASVIPGRFKGYLLCEKPVELEAIARGLFAPPRLDS